MYSAYKLNRVTIHSLDVLLFQFEPIHCSMSSSNCCFLTCIQVSQEAGKMVWYSHLFKNFPQFVVIHIVNGFSIVKETEINDFLKLSCFFYDLGWQFDLWFLCLFKIQLVHLEVHSSRTAEAWLGEFWALLYDLVRWGQLCSSLSILWHYLSLGLKWKPTFSSPVATAKFPKFAGILSASLGQHHLSGFEIAQLEFYHLHYLCS